MTCFEKQMYLPFFRKVDIMSYNLGVFFHIYRKNISASFLNLATNFRKKFSFQTRQWTKSTVFLKRDWILPVPISHAPRSGFRGQIFFFNKYCIKKKIACFLPQSVGSFIVGRHQLAKRNFRYFFPHEFSWKKTLVLQRSCCFRKHC